MVCENIVTTFKLKISGPVDLRLMEVGLKLVYGKVRVEQRTLSSGVEVLLVRTDRFAIQLKKSKDGFEVLEQEGQCNRKELVQAYAAATQYAALIRQGYNVTAEREDGKVRLSASR